MKITALIDDAACFIFHKARENMWLALKFVFILLYIIAQPKSIGSLIGAHPQQALQVAVKLL